MIKILNFIFLIVLISIQANAYLIEKSDTSQKEMLWGEKVVEYKIKVQRIKKEGEEIHELFSIFDLIIIEEAYEELTEKIVDAEKLLIELENSSVCAGRS